MWGEWGGTFSIVRNSLTPFLKVFQNNKKSALTAQAKLLHNYLSLSNKLRNIFFSTVTTFI
jgi:hypothetical protein